MSAGVGHATVGTAMPVNSNPQSTSMLVPPDSRSARYKVHEPLASVPLNELKVVVRGVLSNTSRGSTLRPSGCHVPFSGTPVGGFVTVRYKWMSPLAAKSSNVDRKSTRLNSSHVSESLIPLSP